MQFVDLGFLFLLLPVSAAVYYCFPARFKAFALLAVSLAFCYLSAPQSLWLTLPAAIDCAAIFSMRRAPEQSARNDLLFRLCMFKNFLIMVILGVVRPILYSQAPPLGLMVVMLSMTELLVFQQRNQLESFSPVATASAALFFGRLIHGPVSAVRDLSTQLTKPTPSLSRIARGIMLLIAGIAKQVILSEQLFALLRTISRLPSEQFSVALGWLCALCSALGIYFSLSAFNDIAMGLGNIFSLKLPRIMYYPFQARSIREYIYRLNMPLEDTLLGLIFPQTKREDATGRGYFLSFAMPLLLGLWIFPSGGYLLWGGYLSILVLLDWVVLRHIPAPVGFAARLTTFAITLPAYVLMLPTTFYNRFNMIASIIGLGHVPLINDAVLYLLYSNFALLVVSVLCCSNVFDVLGRATERQFPQLWWVSSSLAHLALLVVSASFLIWTVR